jgi:hypothetical protein
MHTARWRARGLTIPARLEAAYCDCRVRPFLLALDTQAKFRPVARSSYPSDPRMRSTASLRRSSGTVSEMRKNPSPLGP